MSVEGEALSWTQTVDDCLGQACKVLRHATEVFADGNHDEEIVEGAVSLAAAWRELATFWMERPGTWTEDDEEAVDEADDIEADADAPPVEVTPS